MMVAVATAAATSASAAEFCVSFCVRSFCRKSRNVTRALLGPEPWIPGAEMAPLAEWSGLRRPRINSTGAEATRPAHARNDGRSPGSRVSARNRLPGFDPSGLVWARRLQLRGQLRHRNLGPAPHSLFALLREAVDAAT